jgi:hypothetical protein
MRDSGIRMTNKGEFMEEETTPTKSVVTEADFKVGYMVGLNKNDEFVFEVFGSENGAIQLLGLHYIAGKRLEDPFEQEKFRKLYDLLQKTLHVVTGTLSMSAAVPTPPPEK